MFKNKILISIVAFYIFWLCILPLIMESSLKAVCKNFSHNSNLSIVIKNPRLRLSILPIMVLSFEEFNCSGKNVSNNLNIKGFSTRIRLLPLLSGKVHFNNILADEVFASANMSRPFELDKDFFKKLEQTRIKCDSININNIEVKLYQKEVAVPIIYKAYDFDYKRANRYVKFYLNSDLNISNEVSKISTNLFLPKNNDINNTRFDIEISNIKLAPLKNYFKHFIPSGLKELKGEVSANANNEGLLFEFDKCAILMADDAKSIIFPDKLEIKSRFKINRHSINFEQINIKSKNIDAFIDGQILNYFGKTMPTLNLNVRLSKSRISDIISILPPFKIEELDAYKLKKYKFYGDVLANFKIKGRLPEPDLIGDVYISDGILTSPIPNAPKGATIKLNLAGKHVNFDVLVPAGGAEKVFVKGSQEIYNVKYADFLVKSTSEVNLKSAQKVLLPLHEILNFLLGPIPIMELDGVGNIDITVKGNRKSPHIWGVFKTFDAKVLLKDFVNLPIKNVKSNLIFNDQNFLFETENAIFDEQNIKIKGSCDVFGKFDFDILSSNLSSQSVYKAITTSTIFEKYSQEQFLPNRISGLLDVDLKIFGHILDFNKIELNKNLFIKGLISIKNNDIYLQNVEINNANGKLEMDGINMLAKISANIGQEPLLVIAKIKDSLADLVLEIPKLNSNYLISDLETRRKQYLPYVSIVSKYKGSIKEIDYSKLNLKAIILENQNKLNKIKYYPNGVINIANNKVSINNLKGYIDNPLNSFDISFSLNNVFKGTLEADGNIKVKSPDLSLFNDILISDIFPEKVKNYTQNYRFDKGVLDLSAKIVDNKLSLITDVSGISFRYLPFDLPIEILNGNVSIKNNVLKFNKINVLADNMPILLDGEVKDIFNSQTFNLYFNSKPQQEFIDKYINKNQIYPIKIKGDIVYLVKVKGILENFDLKAKMNMNKNSSVYHFGATVGDIENAIELSLDSKVINKNRYKIKEFSYDKIIDSQSGRQTKLNLLKSWGGVKILNDDLAFDNLHIKTNHPTDARIFNIIFRKPNIKQGQFTSDLKLNGMLSDIKVLGDFHIFETNIPFLDTSLKNIILTFNDKTIEFDSKGEILNNDIVFSGILKNKLTIPYKIEKATFYTKNLDLNRIVNKLKIAEVDSLATFDTLENFNLNSIVVNNLKLKADNIQLRNINATNFEAMTALNELGLFDVSDFRFNIAQGELRGNYSYNLKNSNMGINLVANSIDANDITWALFDLNNQIYGDLTGKINLTCNGMDFNSCMQSLNGTTVFNVKDGKMPKLGSLEYLLKAGNLLKGGFTGLSINSVIDIITPLKTGEFSDIYGSIRIKDGIARNIEITTKGKDLNLYIGGIYNFSTSIAEMQVFGLLSKKMSTMFGPIGNISLNTLFNIIPGVDLTKDSTVLDHINKIPGIELSEKAYRKFIAEIKGNINGDDYVTSFKWIN